MLNPWLSFPLQAVRLGWDAQSMVVDQMMRLTGWRVVDQKSPGVSAADTTVTAEVDVPDAPISPVEAATPESGKHRQHKAAKIQKRGKSKHRRAK
jgi:hypothetical protein